MWKKIETKKKESIVVVKINNKKYQKNNNTVEKAIIKIMINDNKTSQRYCLSFSFLTLLLPPFSFFYSSGCCFQRSHSICCHGATKDYNAHACCGTFGTLDPGPLSHNKSLSHESAGANTGNNSEKV